MVPNNTRLNLAEFEARSPLARRGLLRNVECAPSPLPAKQTIAPPFPSQIAKPKDGKTVFIPVGFQRSHLDALAKAVFELKQQGHLNASKSALIRVMVENHLTDAAEKYKSRRTSV